MSKRILPILITIGVIALLAVITVFIVRGVNTRRTQAALNAAAKDPLAYTITMWRLNQDRDPLLDAFGEFESANPGYKVAYVRKDFGTDYESEAILSIAARKGPEIWELLDTQVQKYRKQITPLPLSLFRSGTSSVPVPADVMRKTYLPGVADQLITNSGDVLGVPITVDPLRVYWNPTLFNDTLQRTLDANPSLSFEQREALIAENSRPAATWEGILRQTPLLTRKNGTDITTSAIALGNTTVTRAADILSLLIIQNGGSMYTSDKQRAIFHIPESTSSGGVVRTGENALTFYTSFATPGKENYTWNSSFTDPVAAFATGKVAMVIDYGDFGQALLNRYPNFQYSVTGVPQISVSSTPKTVYRFYADVITTSNPSKVSAASTLMGIYANNYNLAKYGADYSPFTSRIKELVSSNSDSTGLALQVLNGSAIFKTDPAVFNSTMRTAIDDVVSRNIPPAQALDTAANEVNAQLFAHFK